MAFLGGLQGLGGLAGGISQGIGQGVNLNSYLQQQQAQNLAGNILQAYGGGQPNTGGGGLLGGLSNLFGGGQQASAAPSQPLGGLNAAAGQTPVSSQTDVPGLPAGQPGTANPLSNLFSGGGQQAASVSPPQAQPQASPQGSQMMTQPQGQQPQPFDASGRMGGMQQQQMTLPQFVQMVRKVAPNASGRQVMMAAQELGKGGILGFGGITPYQAAGLELRREGADVARERLSLESQKLGQHWDEFKTREQRIEKNTQFAQKKVQSALAFRDAQMKVLELQKQREDRAQAIRFSTDMDDDAKKKALDDLDKKYEAPIGAAQKIADDALKASNESAPSEDSSGGGGGSQPDYANTPDGKMMHYKGSGSRDDASNWEEVQ